MSFEEKLKEKIKRLDVCTRLTRRRNYLSWKVLLLICFIYICYLMYSCPLQNNNSAIDSRNNKTAKSTEKEEKPTQNSTVGIFIAVLRVGFYVVILVVVVWFIRRERRKTAAMEEKVEYLLKNKGKPSLQFESLNLLQEVKTVDQSVLENKYCVISFNSNLHNKYRAMIRSTVDGMPKDKNLTEAYFLIQSEKSVLDIPKHKVIFICVDYNPSNVILETPGQEEEDIKLLTVQACRKIGADVFVIYIGDEGSRNLGVGLMYNTYLKTVTEHFELKKLQQKNRVLTVSQDFSLSQDEAVARAIVQR